MQINKKAWDEEFGQIMQLQTSGSVAFRTEKMLYEKFADASQLDEFVRMEEMTDALAGLGNLSLPPLFRRMLNGMYKDLVERIVQEYQNEIDRKREESWEHDSWEHEPDHSEGR